MNHPAPAVPLARALPPVYAAAAVRAAFPLLLLPVMATRLGAEGFGQLSLLLVWAMLLSTLVEGGFLAAATRHAVAADPAALRRLAVQVFSARCVLSLLVAPLVFAAARTAAPQMPVRETLLLAALACALGWPANWYLQARQQLHRWARVELLVYGLWLAAALAWAHSVAAYLLLQLASAAVLAVAGWAWLARDLGVVHGPVRGLWQPAAVRPGLALGGQMLPVALASAAYTFALPAAAAANMPRAELGLYYLADRVVRALLNAAEPVFQLVYPRIVARQRAAQGRALRYTARWALAGTAAGALLWLAAWWAVPALPLAQVYDPPALSAVFAVLGALLPLLLGWKFFGSWMLGSGRFDTAYRASILAGAAFGIPAAGLLGGHGAVALAGVALAVEWVVIAVALGGMAWRARAQRAGL